MRHSIGIEKITMELLDGLEERQVRHLDNKSGKNYCEKLDDYLVHGLFLDGELAAYALAGPAYEVLEEEEHNYDYLIDEMDYVLEHIFVLEEYREQGLAAMMIKYLHFRSSDGLAVIAKDEEIPFLLKVGFVSLADSFYYIGELKD